MWMRLIIIVFLIGQGRIFKKSFILCIFFQNFIGCVYDILVILNLFDLLLISVLKFYKLKFNGLWFGCFRDYILCFDGFLDQIGFGV